MNLVIVESPTKAKTLSKYLDKNYVIKASMGHIRDLPKSGLGVDVENNYNPEYIVSDKGKKTLSELKKLAKESDTIILAPDPDREGEAIAWHLKELLNSKKNPPMFKRVVFHELTKQAISDAFDHQGSLNMDLVDAQQARRVLDRLVGYKLSPLLWKKVRFGLSAGRVQSVAVRLVVEKERERNAFEIKEFWTIETDFTDDKGKKPFKAEYISKEDIEKEEQASMLKQEISNSTFNIDKINQTQRTKRPNPPLKTSTLQQTMANQFGFTAKKTMMAAQKLFEKGIITYHRTDSINLSNEFINSARDYIKTIFGTNYLPSKPIFYKNNSSNAQEAHEAIRPTEVNKLPSSLKSVTTDELKVYTVIWKRSVESQMESAVYDQTSILIKSNNNHQFKANGSVIKFEGYLIVDKHLNIKTSNSDLVTLPKYEEKEKLLHKETNAKQHFTQPPARYSDATLIKTLEELGIGRPSTYAPTLSTIQARGYVVKDGRYFVPTDVAFVVNDLLVDHFSNIVDFDFTAKMESNLDNIADGKSKWQPVIKDFYEPFRKNLEEKEKVLQKMDVTTLETTNKVCPECGNLLNVKLGKFGKFLSCSNYPDCKYAEPLAEDKIFDDVGNEIKDFGKCPNCEDGVFLLKKGRFGKFLACSNYPKCKTTQPFLEKIGVSCPRCIEGEVVIKKYRGREFYGCSKYPSCAFSSWQDPRNPDFKYDPVKHTSEKSDSKKQSTAKSSSKSSKTSKTTKNSKSSALEKKSTKKTTSKKSTKKSDSKVQDKKAQNTNKSTKKPVAKSTAKKSTKKSDKTSKSKDT